MRHFVIGALGIMVAAVVFAGFSAVADPSGLPIVTPSPRHMAWAESGGAAWLDLKELKSIVVPEDCREAMAGGIEQFAARLRELHVDESAIPKVEAQAGTSLDSGKIYLGVMPNANLESRLASLPAPEPEGYKLLIDAHAVFILGRDLPGLYYGLMTLRQLLDPQGRIARVTVSDWPDMPLRGTYMPGNAGLEARILQCAALKLNFMLFECGDFFSLDDDEVRTRWQNAFALCRKHFIEPVPELQSLGWGHLVLSHYPAAVEAVYIEKKRFDVKDGAVQSPDAPIAPAAPIVNAGFEDGDTLTGWNADGQGEGVTIDADSPHTGKGSLRITRAEKGTMRVFQVVPVLPNSRYELRCFVRTKGIAEGPAYIESYGLKDNGELGQFMGPTVAMKGDHDWERVAVAFDSGTYTKIQIFIRIQDGIGTAWFDDIRVAGLPSMNTLGNVLITTAAPLIVQDESGATTYEEGKDYKVIAGPVTFPFGAGAPTRIEMLPGGRIKDGTAVLLSYHRVPEDSISCCPSEPEYQEYMRKTLHTVAQCLTPKYIHIGHDEPRVLNRDRRCTARKMSNSELFADDITRMEAFAREVDPAIRLMMWSDAVNPYHNGPSLDMNDAANFIPKDVIQCPWWYDYPDRDGRIEKSTAFFLDKGFDVTGSPWFKHGNVYQWAEVLYKHHKDNPHVLGLLYTSWGDTTENPWQALETAAQYAWIIDKMPLEEFLNRQRAQAGR